MATCLPPQLWLMLQMCQSYRKITFLGKPISSSSRTELTMNIAWCCMYIISAWQKSLHALHPISLRSFPNVAFETVQCWSSWWWPFLILSRKIINCFLFPHLSPPGDWWFVSSSSTLQNFRDSSHLWWLLCLLSQFLPLRHVKGSTPAEVYKAAHWILTHDQSAFPFHFPLYVLFQFC